MTAYEMRISDWSSDVCSSDLANTAAFDRYALVPDYLHVIRSIDMRRTVLGRELAWPLMLAPTGMTRLFHKDGERGVAVERSAERRVGKECVSTCRSRGSTYQ